jgi:hypothetical protein
MIDKLSDALRLASEPVLSSNPSSNYKMVVIRKATLFCHFIALKINTGICCTLHLSTCMHGQLDPPPILSRDIQVHVETPQPCASQNFTSELDVAGGPTKQNDCGWLSCLRPVRPSEQQHPRHHYVTLAQTLQRKDPGMNNEYTPIINQPVDQVDYSRRRTRNISESADESSYISLDPSREPLLYRESHGGLSIGQVCVNLMKCAVGAGSFSLPYAFMVRYSAYVSICLNP